MSLLDLSRSGFKLLIVGLSLSIAFLSAMLSIAEAERRETVSALAIPPPDEDICGLLRIHGRQEEHVIEIAYNELLAIRRLEGVLKATALASHSSFEVKPTLKRSRKYARAPISGIDDHLLDIWETRTGVRFEPVQGSSITPDDLRNKRRVCVLRDHYSQQLEADVGDTIDIAGRPFQVVGIADQTGSPTGIPLTVYRDLYGPQAVVNLHIKGDLEPTKRRLESQIGDILGPRDQWFIASQWQEGNRERVQQAQRLLYRKALVGAVPLFITFLGALGMSASWLEERRWSLALLRALGATRQRTALDAFLEPVAAGLASAVLGLVLGLLLTKTVETLAGFEVAYSWKWFALSWAAGLAAMLPAAIYVAVRAAFIPPAEAMRK